MCVHTQNTICAHTAPNSTSFVYTILGKECVWALKMLCAYKSFQKATKITDRTRESLNTQSTTQHNTNGVNNVCPAIWLYFSISIAVFQPLVSKRGRNITFETNQSNHRFSTHTRPTVQRKNHLNIYQIGTYFKINTHRFKWNQEKNGAQMKGDRMRII